MVKKIWGFRKNVLLALRQNWLLNLFFPVCSRPDSQHISLFPNHTSFIYDIFLEYPTVAPLCPSTTKYNHELKYTKQIIVYPTYWGQRILLDIFTC